MISPVTLSGSGWASAFGGRKTGAPSDKFTRSDVPPAMQMTELRALAAARTKPTQKLDINKIKFGVEIEMEGFDMNHAMPGINAMPTWDKHHQWTRWILDRDASLASGGEAKSPVMTLESGEAEKQIRQVMAHFRSLGGRVSNNCSFQVHVDAATLGEQGMMNLMKIALENEHLLFKISQNGAPIHRGTIPGGGYRHDTPYWYTQPLGNLIADPFPIIHADKKNEFRNALYTAIPDWGANRPRDVARRPALPSVDVDEFHPQHRDPVRYTDINFNGYWYMGTIEFRLFNGTDDPDQVIANLQMVLGMAKAAAEGDYAYLKANPLNTRNPNQPVSKENLDYFLSKVAPTPKLAEKLRQTFVASGGLVTDDAPVTDPTVLNAAFLLEEGYHIKGDGKEIVSPLEVAGELAKRSHRITLTEDGGGKEVQLNDAGELEKFVAELEVKHNFSEADVKRMQASVAQLRDKGFSFVYAAANGKADGATSITRDNQLLAAMHRQRLLAVPAGASQEAVLIPDVDYLERYSKLECATSSDIKPEEQEVLAMAADLQKAGCGLQARANSGQVFPLVSRFAILDAMSQGNMLFPISEGVYKDVRSADDLRGICDVMAGREQKLDEDARVNLRFLGWLEGKGVRWSFSDDNRPKEAQPPRLNAVGQLEKLREGTLVAHLPGRKLWNLGRTEAPVGDAERLKSLTGKFLQAS